MNPWTEPFVSQLTLSVVELRTAYLKALSKKAHTMYTERLSARDLKNAVEERHPEFKDAERILTCAVKDLTVVDLSAMALAAGLQLKFTMDDDGE